jgi:uncharacterized membrane protein
MTATPDDVEPGTRLSSTTRTEAFSDGVFAIAVTLLVLEIKVPTAADVERYDGLAGALVHAWPSYLGYLATFLTVGVIWLNHHAFFGRLARIDGPLQWWNLVLLLLVAFTPFPNALVAEYLHEGLWTDEARVATAVYALVFALATVPWIFMWSHLVRQPDLFAPPFTVESARGERPRTVIGTVGYAVAIGVAYAAPILAVVLFIAAAVYFAVTAQGISRERRT